ncbi:MAG TPA: HAD-IA family hydrolase [Candidatus Saccharimonadales bacterium]|nr:HAD-IA family hydrolase [Candidatus Saccharimonadales bacterium]
MKTLIFDFDGTIADSFETFLDIFNEISGRPHKLTAAEVTQLRGKNIKEIIKYLKIRRRQVPRLIIRGKKMISLRMIYIKVFPGIGPAIKQLHASGGRMFIVSTNSEKNITDFLVKAGLEDCFERIYGDIGLRSKSSVIKKIIRKNKLDRRDCFYIGDEVRDIDAAKKAGVTSVGVTWGFNTPAAVKKAGPDIVALQARDLVGLLERG